MQYNWQIYTVVDITQADRHGDKLQKNQHANFNTLLNTASLRCNIQPKSCQSFVEDVSNLGFGTAIVDKQRFWRFDFFVEYEDAVSHESLIEDFDLVPIIKGLNETANINNSAFRTKDKSDKNIIFKLLDN